MGVLDIARRKYGENQDKTTFIGSVTGLRGQELSDAHERALEMAKRRAETRTQNISGAGFRNTMQAARPEGNTAFTAQRESGKYSVAKGLAGVAQKGLGQIAQAGGDTLAFAEDLLLAPLELASGQKLGSISDTAPLNLWAQKIRDENVGIQQYYQENTEKGGKKAEILENLGTATVAAVPQAVIAMLTGGGSTAAQTTAGLSRAAAQAVSPSISGTVTNAVSSMAKNPQYWTSFSQVVGNSYEEALADGASREQAVFNAIGNGLLNAAVEVGGGIETLPGELKNGSSAWKTWVKSALDEGKEEVVQGVIEQAVQNLTYNKNNPLASLTDENALISPQRAAEEFAGGAIVGGILGGGQIAAGRAIDAISRRRGAETTAGAQQTQEQDNIIPQAQEGAQGAAGPQTDVPTQNVQQAFAQQNTAPVQTGAAVNENGLTAFSKREQENLSSGARNKIISTFQDAVSFVRNALSNRQSMDRAYLGKVPEATARRVQADTGIDIQGFGVMMNGNDIRHIMREHGDLMTEQARGQIAITPDDIARIPEVLASPDRIYLSEDTDGKGRRALVFEKQIGDDYITIQGVSNGKQVLQTDTLYKRKRRTRTARDTMLDTNEGAAPVINAQSEPPQSSSINSIPNSQENVNGDVPQSVGAAAAGVDPYTNQLRQFGAIPEGENPSRPIDVPQRTSPENRVSRTARTILEAAATPDSAVGDIGQAVVDGRFSYMPVTNQQATAAAEQTIRSKGWEQALTDWRADVRAGKTSERISALGATLYNNAVNAGDTKAALDIAHDLSVAIRNGARATQAARILKTLTPSGKLYMLQKEVSRLNGDLTEQLTGQRDIQIDEALADAYLNAETDEARNAALQAIYQNIADQMPANFREKWNAWRYMAMLANTRTHVRNILGNTGFQPLRIAKNLVATAIESGLNAAGVNVERTHSFRANPKLYKAAWQDYDNVSDTLGGNKYNDAQSEIAERRRIFKNSILEGIRRKNSQALELEDVVFKRITYADTLANYLRANNVTAEQMQRGEVSADLLARARDFAAQEALKATYQDRNAFSDRVNKIVKASGVAGQAILPFSRTPSNILVRGVEYSPAGLAKALTYDLYQVQQGNKTAAQAIDNIAAGLTGSGLMALGAYLFSVGLVTPGSGDSDDDELNDLMGHQNYALELPNGTSITLDWLAPEALPFFMGVELASSMGENGMDADSILNALTSVANPMLELSMLQSVNDMIDSVQYAEGAPLAAMIPSAIISYFSQAIPTIGGQIERTAEDRRMTTYTDRNSPIPTDVQYALGRASSRIPLWDYQQTPYIDAWGQEEETGGGLSRFLNNFFNPAYVSQVSEDPLEAEIRRLYEQTGDTAVLPDRAPKKFTVDGEDINLTAAQYEQYATMRGQTAFEVAVAMTQNPAYSRLSDTEKVEAMDEVYEYANDLAKAKVSDYEPPNWIKSVEESGISPTIAILYRRVKSSLEDSGMSQSEANSEVRRMLMNDNSLSADVKHKVDEAILSDGMYIPKDTNVDYSNEETFAISQMSEGAQKRWEGIKNRFGIDAETYQATWDIYQDDDLTADQKRARMREYVGSDAAALYKEFGKRLG